MRDKAETLNVMDATTTRFGLCFSSFPVLLVVMISSTSRSNGQYLHDLRGVQGGYLSPIWQHCCSWIKSGEGAWVWGIKICYAHRTWSRHDCFLRVCFPLLLRRQQHLDHSGVIRVTLEESAQVKSSNHHYINEKCIDFGTVCDHYSYTRSGQGSPCSQSPPFVAGSLW